MDRETKIRIAAEYEIKQGTTTQTVNRAIRTLPGGAEVLDAIEASNAARNHAMRAGANERVIAIDAAIDRLEEIRGAMERYVIASVGAHHDR